MTEKKPKKPTSFDVARLANVHRSAVSRALSGKGRVSEETRERVIKAAQELGYRVNYLARSLHDQNSGWSVSSLRGSTRLIAPVR